MQIDELFAKPQAELAKKMKGTEGPGEPPPEPTADELANVTEEQYVRGGLMLGGTREHWQAEYRRQWGKG